MDMTLTRSNEMLINIKLELVDAKPTIRIIGFVALFFPSLYVD